MRCFNNAAQCLVNSRDILFIRSTPISPDLLRHHLRHQQGVLQLLGQKSLSLRSLFPRTPVQEWELPAASCRLQREVAWEGLLHVAVSKVLSQALLCLLCRIQVCVWWPSLPSPDHRRENNSGGYEKEGGPLWVKGQVQIIQLLPTPISQ